MKKMLFVGLLALQAWSADAAAQVINFDDIKTDLITIETQPALASAVA